MPRLLRTPPRPPAGELGMRGGVQPSAVAGLLAWALLMLPAVALPADGDGFRLAPGDTKRFTFERDVDVILVSDAEVADVSAVGIREVVVFAKGVGATRVTVRDADGVALLDAAVQVDTAPTLVDSVIRDVAGPEADIRVVPRGDVLFITGAVDSPLQAERVLRAVRAVVGDTEVVDDLVLDRAPQVNLEVLISEVSRTVSNRLGVDWTLVRQHARTPIEVGFVNGTLLTGDALTAAAEGAVVVRTERTFRWRNSTLKADAFLEALAESGLGVVHAKPNLTAVSGETATFFAGLEIPVPTLSGQGNVTTEFKETGVSLSFKPVVLDEGTISLRVEPEIREIVAGVTIIAGAAIPNINERSVSTTVELADGESMAIAGLYRRSRNRTESGIPLLKDIPLWGALFRDIVIDNETVELIVVVTPRIVGALPGRSVAARTAGGPRRLDDAYYY